MKQSTFSLLFLNLFLSFSLLSSALFPFPVCRFSRVVAWFSPAQPVGLFDPFFLSLIPRSSRKIPSFFPFSTSLPSLLPSPSPSLWEVSSPLEASTFSVSSLPPASRTRRERRGKKRRKSERGEKTHKKPRGLSAEAWQQRRHGNGRRQETRDSREGGGRAPRGGGGTGEGSDCPGSTSPPAPSSSPARSPRPAAPTLSARQEVTGPERAPKAWRSRGRPAPGAAGGAGSRGRAGRLPPRSRRPRPSRKGRRRGEPAAEAERAPRPARRRGTPAREVDAPPRALGCRARRGGKRAAAGRAGAGPPGAWLRGDVSSATSGCGTPQVPPPASFPAYLWRSLCGPSLCLSSLPLFCSFRCAHCCPSVTLVASDRSFSHSFSRLWLWLSHPSMLSSYLPAFSGPLGSSASSSSTSVCLPALSKHISPLTWVGSLLAPLSRPPSRGVIDPSCERRSHPGSRYNKDPWGVSSPSSSHGFHFFGTAFPEPPPSSRPPSYAPSFLRDSFVLGEIDFLQLLAR